MFYSYAHVECGLMDFLMTGAKQPNYLVTADDVDTYLAIEVQPLDDRKRKVLYYISVAGQPVLSTTLVLCMCILSFSILGSELSL